MDHLLVRFSFAAAGIAVFAALAVNGGILFDRQFVANRDSINLIREQIKTCQMASILFCFLAWLIISGSSLETCLLGYDWLSQICLYHGYIWLGAAFFITLLNIFIGLTKKIGNNAKHVKSIRFSFYCVGLLFLLFSALLHIR